MDFSVIIPTLNEEACIGQAIASIRSQHPREIIVVDGGSRDGTLPQAAESDLALVSEPGRAAQMNFGASRASGSALLFLHADCQLEAGALSEAASLLFRPGVIAGCFSMRIQAAGMMYRCIDACGTARVRLTGIAYGDQGLFLKRTDFERLGGFPPLRLMEDLFMAKSLRKLGRIVVAKTRIQISPRRWRQKGLVRQTARNWALTGLVAAGVSPDRLAGYYPHIR